ncbi:ParB N-terminal domain-containing protein [Sulfitobacter mediterraneus]|uniref:ParB/RepB/Spo0J family partition protein n=3 Tax=Sulfitobacter mediterraneus TaxID=83219 RepID=UPI00193945AA|nr:ParB/RepB/Spo0J family partition protein [Sulfitobacter mediterraneus]MBM1558565.1 ParB N-terminal domain-containing protein [Sulfitobacter mediterraneus]MBM1569858.1 ParB N-terminal domain-containing protein [Sulfitobacter mediterraneus]MBM1573738.1 ParB N-terminal domain-containing protein [Sulfitobacter mediterraneus]MBM1577567.1 ParB N-terminal domain-containing protein [Sulfitobacter mediterraneus]MBM1581553.1 ParB N-terminal domain-containing protein [Sulfitobacter mediterraneus]
MTASFKPVSVAIGDLTAHPANVRSNSPETYDPENIAHLKASIAVLGLLQPLLVQKLDGKHAILAGGRRHAALKELVAEKAAKGFTAKTKVECRLVPEDCDVTTALSLAENITQAPMNAIDEFEAFARMMEVDGQTPETIAKTFGTTISAVKGRLRYGFIHPDIRAAARAKVITLDTMKAFAEHPSQEVQKEVYEALTKEDSYLQAYTVRQALQSRGVQVSDDIGAFVREDYEARGGAIAADLLEEHSVLEDAALVETILLEKLGAAAEEARAKMGFAWADAMIRYDYAAMAEYGRVYPGPVEPDEAAQKRVDEITAELEKLQLEMEDEGLEDDAYTALYERVDALEDEARDLQEAYSTEDLARAGVIASWSGGQVTLHVGLVRSEDKQEASRSPSGNQTGKDEPDPSEITYPASLAEDLKTERAMALGAAMALQPEATLDLTFFKLVSDVLGSGMNVTQAIKVEARKEYRSHAKMDEIDGTSLEQVAAAHDALDLSWLDDTRSPADQFAAFRALEAGKKAALVAYATASTTQSCFARDRQRDSLMHDFEIEIMPDIRAHWTPNAALFNRFKKAWLLKILGEDLGLSQEAVTLASSSKKEIVAFCDKLFAEPFATLTDAQRAAVATWCPPMMQTAGVAFDEVAPIAETPEPDSDIAEAA